MEDSSPSVKEVLKLNDSLKYWANKCKELEKEKRELNTKILSAIEYIEKNWIEYSDFQYVDNDDELNIDCESIKELLNILKGGDKE